MNTEASSRNPILAHVNVVAFGGLHALTSSVGQTFFIALFVPSFMAAFTIDRTTFSSIYGACTVASAMVLPFVGAWLDKVSLRKYALIATLTLTLGALWLSFSTSLVMLIIGLFLVRCVGQGVMSDINLTSTGRFFDASRGRAIALTTLGHPIGEALFPLAVVYMLSQGSWRNVWQGVALFVVVASAAGFVLLLKNDTHPEAFKASDDSNAEQKSAETSRANWTRAEVLRAPGFYLLMPFWVLPAVLLTGFFFHQLALADEKGWTHEFVAQSFTVFAICRGITSLLAGPLVDKISARRLMVWSLIPLVFGIGLLGVSDAQWVAPAYFALVGCMGISSTTKGALLPELFGTKHLGAIRALTVTAAVFSTAICPPLFSILLDAGFLFKDIARYSVVFALLTMVLCVLGMRSLEAARARR